nr:hypothetical protein [Tanacetum cinerariifolium]
MIMEENLHVRFSENTPNNVGSGPNWLFDIATLTKIMNYQPVVAQSNDFIGTKASNDAGKEKELDRDYILLPLWIANSPFSTTSKRGEDSSNTTNRVNIVTLNIDAAISSGVNVVGTNIGIDISTNLNMSLLEDIGIFKDSHDDVFGAEADFHNLDSTFQVSHIPTTRIYKDHPLKQVIRDLHSVPQTSLSDGCKECIFIWKNKGRGIKTINDDVRPQALIDGKKFVITEASIRHDLKLNNAE